MRRRTVVKVGLVGAVLAMTGVAAGWQTVDSKGWLGTKPACVVTAGGTVTLSPHQMANAATIAAVGLRKGVPHRGVVVALATATQESKLDNLSDGDRDSIGLFQQRPSQGWGTPEQIADPRYAATAFYNALVRVRGWEEMRVTDAAQLVQKSAFPEAYQQWEPRAEILARAFTGEEMSAVACTLSEASGRGGGSNAGDLAALLHLDWGQVGAEALADPSKVAVPADDARTGWRYAHWMVAHADASGITSVRFGDRQWTASTGDWRSAGSRAEKQTTTDQGSDLVVAQVTAV
jgi:hypothetical protein